MSEYRWSFEPDSKPIRVGRLLVLTDTRTGEQVTLREGETAKFCVRDDGSWSFRRQFTRWRRAERSQVRWRRQRGWMRRG